MAFTVESYLPEFDERLKRLLEHEDNEEGRQISRRHGVIVHSKKVNYCVMVVSYCNYIISNISGAGQ
jgi:hypothetical protein